MHTSRLKNGITYGLIFCFAFVLAGGVTASVNSLSLGALVRLILIPFFVLMVLVVVVQTWEWGFLRFDLPSCKQIVFILPVTLLVGWLLVQFGGGIHLLAFGALIMVLASYFGSLYFIVVGKDHYAFALLLLSMPLMDFFQWESGNKYGIFELQFSDILIEVKLAHIFIASMFGVWIATRLMQRRLTLTRMRLYLPVVLLLLCSLVSFFLFTYIDNKFWAVKVLLTVLVFPLPVFMMMVETIDTKDKMYIIVYSTIVMAVMYVFMSFYMSLRSGVIDYEIENIAEQYGYINYGVGSVAVKGMMLSLITPLVLGLLLCANNRLQVLLFSGLLVLILVAQLMSFSRAGLLATLIGSSFFLIKRRILLISILLLIVVLMFWQPIYDKILVKFHGINSLEDFTMENLSKSRYESWKAAVGMLGEQPIMGVGLKNFRDHALQFGDAFYQTKTVTGESIIVYMHDTHNLFLNVAAELGLVGLGILLWFLVMLLLELIKGFSVVNRHELAPIGLGLLGVYAVHIILGIFFYGFWVVKSSLGINLLIWTLFALMIQLQTVGSRRNSEFITRGGNSDS